MRVRSISKISDFVTWWQKDKLKIDPKDVTSSFGLLLYPCLAKIHYRIWRKFMTEFGSACKSELWQSWDPNDLSRERELEQQNAASTDETRQSQSLFVGFWRCVPTNFLVDREPPLIWRARNSLFENPKFWYLLKIVTFRLMQQLLSRVGTDSPAVMISVQPVYTEYISI